MSHEHLQQTRAIRRTALLSALVALGFYLGFIVWTWAQ